jgi:hypothetical protein
VPECPVGLRAFFSARTLGVLAGEARLKLLDLFLDFLFAVTRGKEDVVALRSGLRREEGVFSLLTQPLSLQRATRLGNGLGSIMPRLTALVNCSGKRIEPHPTLTTPTLPQNRINGSVIFYTFTEYVLCSILFLGI